MLRGGEAFFGEAVGDWGELASVPMAQRDSWPSPDAFRDMRACWDAHGDEIRADREAKFPGINERLPCWGELVFDRGMAPREAKQHLSHILWSEYYAPFKVADAETFTVEGMAGA